MIMRIMRVNLNSFLDSTMAFPDKVPYEILFDLWRNWLAQGDWTPLDKWLKNELRQTALSRLNDEPNNNRELGLCMFSAMRYLQLACALEESYKQQKLLNWVEWDKSWSLSDVKKMPVAPFWFWVAQREKNQQAAPKALRDSADRKAWFEKIEQHFSVTEQPEELLLWNGLRPSWLQLLEDRRIASAWTHEQMTDFIELQNIAPPLWLRLQKAWNAEAAKKRLVQDGIHAEIDAQGNLFATGGRHLSSSSAHKEGWVEIQDLASQQIAAAVDAQPGQKLWDACAGAGGKSLAIAARMKNKGAVFATDLHGYKLDEVKRRAKRAEIFNIRTFEWSGDAPLRLPKEVAQQKGFDWVLVDAPCSSSGTWRRNPDARWRFSSEDSQELILLQQQILTNACQAVRELGHLVYATCSWQTSENEAQIEWFLQQHSKFVLVHQLMVGSPTQNADAMFVAVLQRTL